MLYPNVHLYFIFCLYSTVEFGTLKSLLKARTCTRGLNAVFCFTFSDRA